MRAFAFLVPLLFSGPALSADFTGIWNHTDKVCKYACNDQDPEPDFEVRISITLIQRGKVVCGFRSQNSLADKVWVAPLHGEVRGKILELEEGEPDFGMVDESEPQLRENDSGYPFRVSDTGRFQLTSRGMDALTQQGRRYMTFKRGAFTNSDKDRFVQESSAYLEACLSNTGKK